MGASTVVLCRVCNLVLQPYQRRSELLRRLQRGRVKRLWRERRVSLVGLPLPLALPFMCVRSSATCADPLMLIVVARVAVLRVTLIVPASCVLTLRARIASVGRL